MSQLPSEVEFLDRSADEELTRVRIKSVDDHLLPDVIPRVHIVKYGAYMDEDGLDDPENEVDILARVELGLAQERRSGEGGPPFHGFVLEGVSPYAFGSGSQREALKIAAMSGMPVVRVGRADPGGPVPGGTWPYGIAGSNLDTNKARMLLIAAMLKLGRLPKAENPRSPTRAELDALFAKVSEYQVIFDTH